MFFKGLKITAELFLKPDFKKVVLDGVFWILLKDVGKIEGFEQT
jgi:hypothetical protein